MVPTTGQYMCASRPSAFRSPCQIMTRRFATPFSGRRCAMPFSGSQLNRPACGSCVLHAVRAIQEADRQHTGPQCVPHHSAHIPMPGVGQCSRTIAGPRCGEALTHSALHTRAARARRRVSLGLAPAGNTPGLYLSICLSGNYRSVITSHAWQVVVGLLSLGSKSHHASAHRAPCRLDVRGGRRKAQRPGTSARTSTDLLGRACDPAGSDRLPGADQHHDPVSR